MIWTPLPTLSDRFSLVVRDENIFTSHHRLLRDCCARVDRVVAKATPAWEFLNTNRD